MNIISSLLNILNSEVINYTFSLYAYVLSTLTPTITILFAIYFAGLGWLILRGLLPLSPFAIVYHIVKAAIIFGLILKWGSISHYLADCFTTLPDKALGVLIQNKNLAHGADTVTEIIGLFWQNGCNAFIHLWKNIGNDSTLAIILGIIGYLAVNLLTAVMLFYILMSKLTLSLFFVLAPIFFPMILWKATHNIFTAYIQIIMRWAFIPIFVYLFSLMYFSLIIARYGSIDNLSKMDLNAATFSEFILLSTIAILIIIYAANFATKIAYSVSIINYREWDYNSNVVLKVIKNTLD